ncbi:MAG: OsmC family protein [Archangium sp.]
MTIRSSTEAVGAFRQVLHFDAGHVIHADSAKDGGGGETAPGAHDLFDASLAACKSLTAHWYAKQRGWPLERVTAEVTRDDSHERDKEDPWYGLTVKLKFEGPLTEEQKTRLYDVLERCPVHKLMTKMDLRVTTEPLAE